VYRSWGMTFGISLSPSHSPFFYGNVNAVLTYLFTSPDYKELHVLRQLFPRVPIMALSATCGPQVLADLIKILGLRQVVDGNGACLSFNLRGGMLKKATQLHSQMPTHLGPCTFPHPCIGRICTTVSCRSETKRRTKLWR